MYDDFDVATEAHFEEDTPLGILYGDGFDDQDYPYTRDDFEDDDDWDDGLEDEWEDELDEYDDDEEDLRDDFHRSLV